MVNAAIRLKTLPNPGLDLCCAIELEFYLKIEAMYRIAQTICLTATLQ